MDDIFQKIELFKRVSCLGWNDIAKAFNNNKEILDKYEYYREKDGEYGNFTFLYYLDRGNAKMFFDYLGLRSIHLEKKGSLLNSIKFIQKEEEI